MFHCDPEVCLMVIVDYDKNVDHDHDVVLSTDGYILVWEKVPLYLLIYSRSFLFPNLSAISLRLRVAKISKTRQQ